MKLRGCAVPATLALVLALTGCHGGSNGTVTPARTLSNVTGDYTGTVTDATAGVQNATLTLSEHGSAVGGALLVGAAGATSIALALTLGTSNALDGSGTLDTVGRRLHVHRHGNVRSQCQHVQRLVRAGRHLLDDDRRHVRADPAVHGRAVGGAPPHERIAGALLARSAQ